MSSSPSSILDFESCLYPNESSEVGFLQPGQRLADVLQADEEVAKRHGVTLYQLGCVLERIVFLKIQSKEKMGKYKIIAPLSTNGYQECPFKELDEEIITYGRTTITVQREDTDESFVFESLLAHLVKDHGFCEGPGTQYRLDPEVAIRFFEIQPEIDYTPKFETSMIWESNGSGGSALESMKMISMSLAQFSQGFFTAILFPAEPPYFTKWMAGLENASKMDLWRAKLEDDYKPSWIDDCFEVEYESKLTPEERAIRQQEEKEKKIQQIEHRIQQYQNGILEPGLVVLILGDKTFDYPDEGGGLTSKPVKEIEPPNPILSLLHPDEPNEPKTITKAYFTIPALKLELSERFYGFPHHSSFRLRTKRIYL